jgi:phage shock protein PspC (stress-responsive transcriptional regulator)
MQKVISINLNGNAYQFDEDAYQALVAYLDRAQTELRDNPDRLEILADLEQAIAEKCRPFINAHKTVVVLTEVQRVLAEMGPVRAPDAPNRDAAEDDPQAPGGGRTSQARTDTAPPKRLYQIQEGAMLSGVCAGLAAYLHVDVTVIRLIFVVLAWLTHGAWAIVYIALAFVIPYATTSEERAAAYGLPFSAQDLVDQAKRNYAEFKTRDWTRQRRQWRRQWRRGPLGQPFWMRNAAQHVGYASQIWAGIMLPVFGVITAALFIVLILAVVSLVNTGTVFEWPVPPGIPLWASVLTLFAIFHLATSPLRAARYAVFSARTSGFEAGARLWSGLLWIALLATLLWVFTTHTPEVQEIVRGLPDVWRRILQSVRTPGPTIP